MSAPEQETTGSKTAGDRQRHNGDGVGVVLGDVIFKLAIESIEEAVLVTSTDLVEPGPEILYVNPGFTAMTGYEASDVVGRSPRLLQGPHTDRLELARLKKALEVGSSFNGQTVNYKKDGSEYSVEWTIKPIRSKDGRIQYWVSTQRDITQRRTLETSLIASEKSLRESEARLARAVAAAKMSTWEWDATTDVFSFSAGWEELHGRPAGSMTTLAATLETLHPDDRASSLQTRERAIKGELDEFAAEFRVIFPDKSIRWLLSTGRADRDENRALIRLTGITQDITDRHEAEQRIAYLARHDGLTGLANRATLQEQLAMLLEQTKRRGGCAVLALDLDDFKSINDTFGHAAGDELLRSVARRLRATVRAHDFIARPGGDEFVIIQPDLRKPLEAEALADRLIKELQKSHEVLGETLSTGVSIGIALAPSDASSVDQVLRCADLALYDAKQQNGNCFRFFEAGLQNRAEKRRAMDVDLRRAFQHGEFELLFLPFVRFADMETSGFEALLRWRHPLRGLLSPEAFIGAAEESGMIETLGAWVLKTACAEAANWPSSLRLAVNLSGRQFSSGRLPSLVLSALADAKLASNQLELDITETTLTSGLSSTIDQLRQIRLEGVSIAVDDFGVGQSSLTSLAKSSVDRVKIDRSLVKCSSEKHSASVIRAIVALCSDLDIQVTAEGVETRDCLEQLTRLKCPEGQGFFFALPIPASGLPDFFRR